MTLHVGIIVLALATVTANPVSVTTDSESGDVTVTGLTGVTGARGSTTLRDCRATDALLKDGLLIVTCGLDGVLTYAFDGSGRPELTGHWATSGRALHVFEHRGEVWVEVERKEAVPLAELTHALAPFARGVEGAPIRTGTTAEADVTRLGHGSPGLTEMGRRRGFEETGDKTMGTVRRIDGLEASIDLEPGRRLRIGELVEIAGGAPRGVVARVTGTAASSATIALGLGEVVTPGSKVLPTDEKDVTASFIAPPRQRDLFEIGGEILSYLPLGTLGFGSLTSLGVAYRFVLPIVVEARVQPLGLATSYAGDVFAMSGWLSAGLDAQLFELKLGAGGATVNHRPYDSRTRGAFELVPALRVGARDGLHLSAEMGVYIYEREFRHGFTHVVAQIPLGRDFALRLRGGGGDVGHAFGDLGVRYLLFGNGGRGSLFVTGALGGAWLSYDKPCRQNAYGSCFSAEVSLAGPSLGIGVEWRP